MMPVPDGQREKKETGTAAGIARCLRPAASLERRRRRRAKGPALGWAGPGPPLPGRREVERAGGRWRVRPCAGPPACPSSRRRGSAGPMRKCSAVIRRPRRPLPATSCQGWGGGAPSPDLAARARWRWQLQPCCLSSLRSPLRVPFLEGPASCPPASDRAPLHCNQAREGEGLGSGFRAPGRRRRAQLACGSDLSPELPHALCDLGQSANPLWTS